MCVGTAAVTSAAAALAATVTATATTAARAAMAIVAIAPLVVTIAAIGVTAASVAVAAIAARARTTVTAAGAAAAPTLARAGAAARAAVAATTIIGWAYASHVLRELTIGDTEGCCTARVSWGHVANFHTLYRVCVATIATVATMSRTGSAARATARTTSRSTIASMTTVASMTTIAARAVVVAATVSASTLRDCTRNINYVHSEDHQVRRNTVDTNHYGVVSGNRWAYSKILRGGSIAPSIGDHARLRCRRVQNGSVQIIASTCETGVNHFANAGCVDRRWGWRAHAASRTEVHYPLRI